MTSLNFTTWTLTVFRGDLFAGIALFADGARLLSAPLFGLKENRPRIN
ncbi:hypothetical protein ANMWB30_26320 [Arthrobacter sp. MWB30]|nr:hypothetical protein ANMWB30_26320 [Arthrobacter sp. MWB30]